MVGFNVNNTWSLTGTQSGSLNGMNFVGITNLTGGTANDTFQFTNAAAALARSTAAPASTRWITPW